VCTQYNFRATMGEVTMGDVTMGDVTMGDVTMGDVTMGEVLNAQPQRALSGYAAVCAPKVWSQKRNDTV